jgi:hypothetical protein
LTERKKPWHPQRRGFFLSASFGLINPPPSIVQFARSIVSMRLFSLHPASVL